MDRPQPGEPDSRPALEAESAPRGFMAWLRHAFAIEKYDESSLADEEKAALQGLADRIHTKRMTTAAILWFQSNRHMNMLGSNAMIAAQPVFEMAHPVLNGVLRHIGLNIPPEDYKTLYSAFEKRYSTEYLVQQLETRLAQQTGPEQASPRD